MAATLIGRIVIVDPYGVEHEGKVYFCSTAGKKKAYSTNPPPVNNTSDTKYEYGRAAKLYKIAQQLHTGKIAPVSYFGNEEDDDDEFVSATYDAFVASHLESGAHAGPSTTTGSRPGSRGSVTGQPSGAFGYSAQQQHHHQQQQHFAHAGPSQQAPAPAAQTAATLPYRPQCLGREDKNEALQVLFDPEAEHYFVQGVSDTKPNKPYQIFWSDKRSKFYILKTVTDSKGKKKQEPVYLKDRSNYQ
jgi:hypothetical protein